MCGLSPIELSNQFTTREISMTPTKPRCPGDKGFLTAPTDTEEQHTRQSRNDVDSQQRLQTVSTVRTITASPLIGGSANLRNRINGSFREHLSSSCQLSSCTLLNRNASRGQQEIREDAHRKNIELLALFERFEHCGALSLPNGQRAQVGHAEDST